MRTGRIETKGQWEQAEASTPKHTLHTSHRPSLSIQIHRSFLELFLAITLATTSFAGDTENSLDTPPTASLTRPRISWFRRHFGQVTWEEARAWCKTPKDVCELAANQIMYERESQDIWNHPKVTWSLGKGDCEDFAVCVVELCKQLGYDAAVKLYFPRGRSEGHAIAYGTWNGKMWMSNLGTYKEISCEDDIADAVAADLWCDPDKMWTVSLDYAAIQNYVRRR